MTTIKKLLVTTTLFCAVLGGASVARAGSEVSAACAPKQAKVATAQQNVKDIGRLKYTACKGMKGDERDTCKAGIKSAHVAKKDAARAKVKEAKASLKCCEHPKAKSCVS